MLKTYYIPCIEGMSIFLKDSSHLKFDLIISVKCFLVLDMGSRIFYFDFQILQTNEITSCQEIQFQEKNLCYTFEGRTKDNL